MARIRLEEALALGLIPPDQVSALMARYPAVGRSQTFGSPLFIRPSSGSGALQRNLFSFGSSGGGQTPRFGLGALLQGLGLSPAPSAVTSPGQVPVGAASRRREDLTPEQQMEVYRQMERAGALPRPTAAPTIVPQAATRSAQVPPQVAQQIRQAAGPEQDVQQALSAARKALGITKDVMDDQSLLRQVVDPMLGIERAFPTPSPALAAEVEMGGAPPSDIFNPNLIGGGGAGAFRPFTPNVGQTALEGGAVAPPGFDPATATPFEISPEVLSGVSGGAEVAAGVGAGVNAGADLGMGIGATLPAAGEVAGQSIAPWLSGAGAALGLGTGIFNLVQGNLRSGIPSTVGTLTSLALASNPATAGFAWIPGVLAGASGMGSLFGPEDQAINQAREHQSILKGFGIAFPQRLEGAKALQMLSPTATPDELLQASDAIRTGLLASGGISQFVSTGGGREKNIPGVDTSFYDRPIEVGGHSLPVGTVLMLQNVANAIRVQDALFKRGSPLGSPNRGYDRPLLTPHELAAISPHAGVDTSLVVGGNQLITSQTPGGGEESTVFQPSPHAQRVESILQPGATEEQLTAFFRELNPNFDQTPLAAILQATPQVPGQTSPAALPPPPGVSPAPPAGQAPTMSQEETTGAALSRPPSMQTGGLVPRTGTYTLHQGEMVLPTGQMGQDVTPSEPAQEMYAYLAVDSGGVKWAKKNPDADKYWRLAFTPQEARAALLDGDQAEIPVVVPRSVTHLPGRRMVAAVEAARQAQHQDPVRTLWDFLSPAVATAPPLFNALSGEAVTPQETFESLLGKNPAQLDRWSRMQRGVPSVREGQMPLTEQDVRGGQIADSIVPLEPSRFNRPSRMPMARPAPMSVGVGL